MKEYVFSSFENAGRTLLIFLIIWVFLMMIVFINALRSCMKGAPPSSTVVNVGYGTSLVEPVGPSFTDALNKALRITEIMGIFIFILEICFFMLLMLS